MPNRSVDEKAATPVRELNLNTVVPLQYFRNANSGLTTAEMELGSEPGFGAAR